MGPYNDRGGPILRSFMTSPLYRQAVRSEMQQLRLADRAEMDQELEHLNRTAAKLPPPKKLVNFT